MTLIVKPTRNFGSNLWRWTKQAEVSTSTSHEQCSRCGAPIIPHRLSLRELVGGALCGVLLLSIIVPACWATEQWVERQARRLLDRAVWHEPLDDWNQ